MNIDPTDEQAEVQAGVSEAEVTDTTKMAVDEEIASMFRNCAYLTEFFPFLEIEIVVGLREDDVVVIRGGETSGYLVGLRVDDALDPLTSRITFWNGKLKEFVNPVHEKIQVFRFIENAHQVASGLSTRPIFEYPYLEEKEENVID